MSRLSNQELMDRIIKRMESEPNLPMYVTTRDLSAATSNLLDTAKQLNQAFGGAVIARSKDAAK